jgi:c-di-GMP-binding flagellar brake protein YcgR
MDEKNDLNERRKYKRVVGRLKITYKMVGETQETSVYSIDVSAGGFCIGLNKIVKNDTVLELIIHLPDKEKSFYCLGRVVWQKLKPIKGEDGGYYYETGLQFADLELKNRLRLIYYVHGRMKKPKDTP